MKKGEFIYLKKKKEKKKQDFDYNHGNYKCLKTNLLVFPYSGFMK